ncbi:MAG TPA: hypothetical protein EYG85_00015 [Crocinitomix sp.]|nr:hypothetical protein [Crocinitomix sp.]
MKKLFFIIGAFLFSVNSFSQTDPDQNPNYQVSQKKYAEKADEINQTQGQTIQNTYTAFDWTEYKAQKKQDRKDARYNKRQMKYRYYGSCNYNNGYNNNGYYNNGYYNNGYYGNTPSYNSVVNTLLLGAALYSIFN